MTTPTGARRRSLLRTALLTTVTILTTAAPAWASTAGAPVTLPAPSGRHQIGTVSLHLVDRSRPDPWVPSVPYRELMVSVWYPSSGTGQPVAPYLRPGAAERFDTVRAPQHGIPSGRLDWAATRTHAREGAPADPRGGRRPVVLYSPGSGDPRGWGTVLVEELASRGYVVVTVDHTYESPAVEFPDGSVRGNEPVLTAFAQAEREGTVPALLEKLLRVRVDDTRFVLDGLAALPGGLSRVVDVRRVGMFGQSAGGITAAQGMYEDRRIRVGIDLDGTLEYNREPNGTNLMPVAVHGLDRPFLLMGRHGSDHTSEPSWRAFWSHRDGWLRDLTLAGSRHQTYTDLAAILPQAGVGPEVVERRIGTIDPGRAVAAQRAYVVSFFDRWLRGHDDHLLDGPSPCYPEVVFVP
ncbi:lipase [Micromonosporaceae bacterium B7E4]